MIIDLSGHQNYKLLKKHFINLKDEVYDFPTFINGCLKIADFEVNQVNNVNCVYGFTPFDNRYYDKKIFNIDLMKSDVHNKVVGDMLEIFCAFFMQYNAGNTIFGIEPGTFKFTESTVIDSDIGCDAIGKLSTTKDLAAIQVKFRSNPKDHPLDKNVFCSLYTHASLYFDFDPKNSLQKLIFFTNISVGSNFTDIKGKTLIFSKLVEKFGTNRVILIGKNEIENIVGDKRTNIGFWEDFFNSFTQF